MIKHFFTPGLAIHSYMVVDEKAKRAAVIDPTRAIEEYVCYAKELKVAITDIFETHVHADFLSGALDLKAVFPEAVIHCSAMGGKEWIPSYADHLLKDGDTVNVGSMRLEACHTPGHTLEHMAYLLYDEQRSLSVPKCLFSGDLLFVGSVGRPDLLGMKAQERLTEDLYRSLFQRIYAMPDWLVIYPGHGAGSPCGKAISADLCTALGYEKLSNPWLIPAEYGDWKALLLEDMPAVPSYFMRMKKENLQGRQGQGGKSFPAKVLTKKELDELLPMSIVVDIRSPEAYAAGHLKGAWNIFLGSAFVLWWASLIPIDRPVVVMADQLKDAEAAIKALRLVGLEAVAGVVLASQWSADEKKADFEASPMMSIEELQNKKDQLYLLDVRSPQEWQSGHIAGAHHLELPLVPQALDKIPRDRPIAVICRSGARAGAIASLIHEQEGVSSCNVRGGMQAWEEAGYATVV